MTKAKQRFIVLLAGIVICLVVLEISLRIVGSYYGALSESDKRIPTGSKEGQVTILSIGDSVTFGIGAPSHLSYPAQLERMLNQSNTTTKYRVINRGRPAQNTAQLLTRLKSQLDELKPDIVTILIGAQNQMNFYGYRNYLETSLKEKHILLLFLHDVLDSVRIYKFARLLIQGEANVSQQDSQVQPTEIMDQQINAQVKETRKQMQHTDPVQTTQQYSGKRGVPPAHLSLEELENYVDEYAIFPLADSINEKRGGNTPECLAALDLVQKGGSDKALELILNVTKKIEVESECYNLAGQIYKEHGRYDEAIEWYKKGIKRDPGQFSNYEGSGFVYSEQNQFQQALNWFKKGFEKARNETLYVQCYRGIAEAFRKTEDFRGATEFFLQERKREPMVDDHLQSLAADYLSRFQTGGRLSKIHDWAKIRNWIKTDVEKIIDMCNAHNARVVLQNYPVQSGIKSIYTKIARERNIPFVDQHTTFKPYVKKGVRSKEYFVADGHPNEKGYRMMADNILSVFKKHKLISF